MNVGNAKADIINPFAKDKPTKSLYRNQRMPVLQLQQWNLEMYYSKWRQRMHMEVTMI